MKIQNVKIGMLVTRKEDITEIGHVVGLSKNAMNETILKVVFPEYRETAPTMVSLFHPANVEPLSENTSETSQKTFDWLPISSAPRDGSYIMGRCDGTYTYGLAFIPMILAWDLATERWTGYKSGNFVRPLCPPDLWLPLPPSHDGNKYPRLRD